MVVMRIYFIFIILILSENTFGQGPAFYIPHIHVHGHHGRKTKMKRVVFGFSYGYDLSNNKPLFDWFKSYNLNAGRKFSKSYGLSLYFGVGKCMSGIELNGADNSYITNMNYAFLIGRPVKCGNFTFIPTFGLGASLTTVIFQKSVPPPLASLNVSKGYLKEHELFLKPHVKVLRTFSKSAFAIEFDIGCKIYPYADTWQYGKYDEQSKQKIFYHVSDIPKYSVLHPYISLLIGLGTW
jgi:hypothetical protein